jgi:hypothetical protein
MHRITAMANMIVVEADQPRLRSEARVRHVLAEESGDRGGDGDDRATQAVILRMSSFCYTLVEATFSAAIVVCVEVRVW